MAFLEAIALAPAALLDDQLVAFEFLDDRGDHLGPLDCGLPNAQPVFRTTHKQHAIEIDRRGVLGKVFSLNVEKLPLFDAVLMGTVTD